MAALPSPLPVLLPDPSALRLESISRQDDVIVLTVTAAAVSASCPACGTRSSRIHSRYCRVLRDLAWQGAVVHVYLWTRRFYCRVASCECRVFTQRLPHVVKPYARETNRHRDAVLVIGYALGGEAGRRLALQLGISVSADTILRVLRRCDAEAIEDVKVLGVDDWAWRRGHRYGTVLVDLERHRAIDLLPDRESETLAEWLRAHPTIQVVSRDRAGAYAEGVRQGAPNAIQVADRFHLLCNLSSAVQRVLERLSNVLQKIAIPEEPTPTNPTALDNAEKQPAATDAVGPKSPAKLNKHQHQHEHSREKRKALFEAVRDAYGRGLTKRSIAQQLGLNRTTVRRYLRSAEFPERAPRKRRSALDSHREYLEKRWSEGCHNASQLCRELRKMGYGGQRSRVKEYVQAWRNKTDIKSSKARRTLPNLKLVALWLTKPAIKRSAEEQRWAEAVTSAHPQIAASEQFANEFRQVFKDHDSEGLRSWLDRALASDIPELKGFVSGIERDYDAVNAAVTQAWSNGQVEGQVHRIKLLKRQMYGRSGFALLRRRVLPLHANSGGASP
jgi:transposase